MNKKKVSALVLAGLISSQTLGPAMTTFADEIEKANVVNEQVQNQEQVENKKEQHQEEVDKSEVENSKEEKQELENKEEVLESTNKVVDNSKAEDSEKVVDNGSTFVENGRTYVTIPDVNLRKQINRSLGYGEIDAYVSLTDMEKLTEIEIDYNEGKNIQSLKGLERAINLKKLRLSNSNISDVSPLSGLTNLSHLELYYSNISDVSPLSGLTNLKKLYLDYNNISDVSPLSGLTNLLDIHLQMNNISDISPLSGLTKLMDIRLDNDLSKTQNSYDDRTNKTRNNVSDISVLSRFTNLEVICMNGNNISDISVLSGLKKLRYIRVNENHISDISPLKGVSLSGNKVSQIYANDQIIEGVDLNGDTVSAAVDNIVKDENGNLISPNSNSAYTYTNGKVVFKNINGSDKVSYSFSKVKNGSSDGYGHWSEFSGTVTHKVVQAVKAELNKEKGGMMLSTAGLGLRFFTTLKNVDPNEAATYYITTASDKSETPKFEVKSTVLNKDYSQIKTSIEFSELSKLEEGVNTKLYVKRVVEGQEPTYTELKIGTYDLRNGFRISDNKTVSVSATKNNENVVQLNKSTISSSSFNQGVSNIYWNSTGMVVEGTPTNNGSSNEFKNAKVSMLFKDADGNYIQETGTSKNLEFRGMYRDGKYKITIPYDVLENAKSFELRLIGSNIQTTDVLTRGTVEEFKIGMNGDKLYKLSEGTGSEVNLAIESLSTSSSNLSSVKVTTDKTTGIRQFSVTGDVSITGMDKIESNVKYTIVGKKAGEVVFEQSATKINNNGFKTNLSLTTLQTANLQSGDEVSLELKVEYLGNTINIELNSTQAAVSITDKESKEIFEMSSKDGKAVVTKK